MKKAKDIEEQINRIKLMEYLLNQVDELYNAGNTLRCACRMTIRHYLADIDVRLELSEEHKLMDDLEKLWEERDIRKSEESRQKTLETILTKKGE